ncbi:MAG TPA: hypothetical protein VLB67_06955 [Acidimicrobiia bacterium]|nr:hypothetical protein [Acidimicrobiia bacterium]
MDLRTARIIAGSLAAGPVILWVVAWVVTGGGNRPVGGDPTLSPGLGFWIWAVVALVGYAAALVLRQKALDRVERRHRSEVGAGPDTGSSDVHTYLLVAWALLEGPAILSGVLYLLIASNRLLLTAVPIHAIGVLMTFPRPEWYDDSRGEAWNG